MSSLLPEIPDDALMSAIPDHILASAFAPEPKSDAEVAAETMWKVYEAYRAQGFTDQQAMALCIAMLKQN